MSIVPFDSVLEVSLEPTASIEIARWRLPVDANVQVGHVMEISEGGETVSRYEITSITASADGNLIIQGRTPQMPIKPLLPKGNRKL